MHKVSMSSLFAFSQGICFFFFSPFLYNWTHFTAFLHTVLYFVLIFFSSLQLQAVSLLTATCDEGWEEGRNVGLETEQQALRFCSASPCPCCIVINKVPGDLCSPAQNLGCPSQGSKDNAHSALPKFK